MDGEQCIFCSIVSGAVASKRIYEDDKVLGILDINPANPGHILLLPKQHFGILPQMPDDIVSHMGMVAKHLSLAILRSGFGFQGTNIFLANGEAAGQRAQHVMLHVVPRGDGDKLMNFQIPSKQLEINALEEARDGLANTIKEQLGFDIPKDSFGQVEQKPEAKPVASQLAQKSTSPAVQPPGVQRAPSAQTPTQQNSQQSATPVITPQPTSSPPPSLDLDDLTDFLTGGKHA